MGLVRSDGNAFIPLPSDPVQGLASFYARPLVTVWEGIVLCLMLAPPFSLTGNNNSTALDYEVDFLVNLARVSV